MSDNMKTSVIPLISVVMPAYNCEKFIDEAIRSVIDQTFTNWELYVIDDCSTDSTCSIVKQLALEDNRIFYVKNEKNMGVAKTRNRGFDLCKGEYVALLDSDDVWYPEKLELQLRLAQKSKADIIYCSYEIIDEIGTKICDDFIVPENTDFSASLIKGVISCSTALLSRNVIDNYRFGSNYYHEDLALWLRLLRDGRTACGLRAILAKYRILEGARASNKIRSAINRWHIYHGYLGLSAIRSAVLLFQYALLGVKKYRRRKNRTLG